MAIEYPYEVTPDQILVVERRKALRNPNVRYVDSTFLKEGPRTYIRGTIFEIVDGTTGEFHHYSLKIETLHRGKTEGWKFIKERSITLDSQNQDGISKLLDFVESIAGRYLPSEDGRYIVIDGRAYDAAGGLLRLFRQIESSEKIKVVHRILKELAQDSLDPQSISSLLQLSDDSILREIAVASRLVEYKKALEQFRVLIEDSSTLEPKLQKHLEKNPWIFGSEYSQLLDRHTWVRDDKQDFMLRRTVDGFLEAIEIKRAIREDLFLYDKSHDSYYPSSAISRVLGQVVRYIEQIERMRDSIIAQNGEDPGKIRARIIIGHDGNSRQQRALRDFNAHLHGIEILTFDQLLRISERVLRVFESEVAPKNTTSDEST